MKKMVCWLLGFFCLFLITNQAEAASEFSHIISLEPGWNLVSTPRLLASHSFSASSTSANYDIYVMNPGSASKWATMAELGQSEFQPLFGYFINNKVGTTTTLTFDYQQDVTPNDRFFSRNLLAGWNVVGIANPSYSLKQKDPYNIDTNNVKSILDSLSSSVQSVYDLTANQSTKYSTKVSDKWTNAIYSDANSLNDFRETKAYVVYNTADGVYNGYQNNDQIELFDYQVTDLKISNGTSSATKVKVGDEKAELGSFTLGFTVSNSTADIALKSIRLKNNGVEDLSKTTMNLYLENAGNKVSVNTVVDGRYVTFYFASAGLGLLKDDSPKIFHIKGDIIAKENTLNNSFALVLEKSTDLVANDKMTGSNISVYVDDGTIIADAYAISNITIDAGAISVSKKATSPSETTIIKGSDNVMLLANIRADEAITADGLNIKYTGATLASTTDQFENVRVYLNGVLFDSFDPTASSPSNDITKLIDSTLNLSKGDNEIKIMAKAKTTATNGAIRFILDDSIFASQNPEYVVSGNAVSGSIFGSAIGGLFTVSGAVLTTARSDGYPINRAIIRGSSDVSLGKFTLKASNDDIKVTSVVFGSNIGSAPDANINDMKLYVDGSQVGTIVDFGSAGSTFSSLNFTIAKDSTKAIELKGSFNSSATGTFQTLMTVNAQDTRGSSITAGNTATTTMFAIAAEGTLNAEVSGNTPASAILVSKAAEQEVAQFKFTAINDSADLSEINVVNSASSTATSTADARIAAIKLYDGATLIDSFVPTDGGGKFTITNNKILIVANSSKTLSIKVSLNNIDNDAGATNKDVKIRLTAIKAKSSTGIEYTSANTNVDANMFRIRKTVPTVALAALPATLLTAGDAVISKFTVTADSNGDVTLKKVVLTVATSSATLAGMSAGNAVRINGSMKALASSTISAAGLLTLDFADSAVEVISAGTSKTFEVYGTVSGTLVTGSSVTSKIVAPTSFAAASSFEWSDGASVTTTTYSNGYEVPGLTTMTQAMSK